MDTQKTLKLEGLTLRKDSDWRTLVKTPGSNGVNVLRLSNLIDGLEKKRSEAISTSPIIKGITERLDQMIGAVGNAYRGANRDRGVSSQDKLNTRFMESQSCQRDCLVFGVVMEGDQQRFNTIFIDQVEATGTFSLKALVSEFGFEIEWVKGVGLTCLDSASRIRIAFWDPRRDRALGF